MYLQRTETLDRNTVLTAALQTDIAIMFARAASTLRNTGRTLVRQQRNAGQQQRRNMGGGRYVAVTVKLSFATLHSISFAFDSDAISSIPYPMLLISHLI